MTHSYTAADWQTYPTEARWNADPKWVQDARELETVDDALACLVSAGILPHRTYDSDKLQAMRTAVRQQYDIPWTGISPRLQRLIYAINAIAQPQVMVAVGVFCGFTFTCNAGAAVGPGACYTARRLVGIEINPEEAARARRNVATLDSGRQAEIVAAEGAAWLRACPDRIDLLYLDVTATESGKSIYFTMLEAARHALHADSLVLAHNTVDSAKKLAAYLDEVRNPQCFRASASMCIDSQGLEVTAGRQH